MSFGDPNAQPPTPRQTPTSAVFPSPGPGFETPKHRHTTTATWTPRFAEDYSVFNTTPGNLRGAHDGLFDGILDDDDTADTDFAPLTQFPSSGSAHKRQLSAEGLAAEIASHATHFSPDNNLPPVDPSRTLQSSPRAPTGDNALETFSEDDTAARTPKIRSAKKAKKAKAVERPPQQPQEQTITPPPSTHKGSRKLAPRLPSLPSADTMQNDQGYGHHPDFTGTTSQQPGMAASFSATDMFGYPMSAPAGAGANFWDPNADLGMDLDFAAFGGHNLFQTTPTQQTTPAHTHRSMHSFDASQMFQEPSMPVHSQQISTQTLEPARLPAAKTPRTLAPKAVERLPETNIVTTSMSSMSFTAPSEDPFALVSPGRGVDPGLLFSRPPSSGLDAGFRQPDPMTQFSMASVAQALSKPPVRSDIRRSNSSRDLAPARPPDRALASSPLKANGRPGLQRSFSENRGRRNNTQRAPLPTLAPAIRPTTTIPSVTNPGPSRPPSARSTGRTSPLKSHTRLSSLTSIPEAAPQQRTRTSVKFTIDAKGRARAETTVVVEDPCLVPVAEGRPPLGIVPRRREQSFESEYGDDDESSSDDEPIIIPSRNTSFALPDPRKPSGSMFHQSRRSVSERSSSSHATGGSAESEAETVMDPGARGQGHGDAASELRKLVEGRQKRMPQMPVGQRFASSGSGSFSAMPGPGPPSPDLFGFLTPSTHTGGRPVRCVCHRGDGETGRDVFMVQW